MWLIVAAGKVFGVVTGTLGSKYLGQRNDDMFLRLSIYMAFVALLFGVLLGAAISLNSNWILNLFTDNSLTIDAVEVNI